MKTFKELEGLEGIDILNACVEYVDEILADKELFESIKEKTWVQSAEPVYKAHTESINRIVELLGEEMPTSSTGIIMTVAQLLSGIFSDRDTCAFFMASCKNAKPMTSATQSTKDEQSKDT